VDSGAVLKESLLRILRSPHGAEPLTLLAFRRNGSEGNDDSTVLDGALLAAESGRAYPIIDGVPVMLDVSFPPMFSRQYEDILSKYELLFVTSQRKHATPRWSFSNEWDQHFNNDLRKTWGFTVEDRVKQFYLETDVTPEECKGKLILDAGCGNGQLTEALSALGASVVGIDYSTSVFNAERHMQSSNVHFIQGDLQAPPFNPETFDIIISNGVLHHTASTYKTFCEVAKLAKPGGRFYLWLYRRPERFLRRYFFWPTIDLIRGVVTRLPYRSQAIAVKSYAVALLALHKILGKYRNDRYRSWPERVVDAYDSVTPRWRHYHTPAEVAHWFFTNGFSRPTLTHWDNPIGFGMVATKIVQGETPGINFGKKHVIKRYWQ
jgi:2-polyprenyl-3-methyl-5-hydroxy-6-metoxy-1,4-benzoquinol methylase/uncharacterized protein YbaR (Trm112 family)